MFTVTVFIVYFTFVYYLLHLLWRLYISHANKALKLKLRERDRKRARQRESKKAREREWYREHVMCPCLWTPSSQTVRTIHTSPHDSAHSPTHYDILLCIILHNYIQYTPIYTLIIMIWKYISRHRVLTFYIEHSYCSTLSRVTGSVGPHMVVVLL